MVSKKTAKKLLKSKNKKTNEIIGGLIDTFGARGFSISIKRCKCKPEEKHCPC